MQETVFDISFLGTTYPGFYVKTPVTATEILKKLMSKDVLFSLDTETAALPKYKTNSEAGLSPHLSQIRLLQIFDGTNSFIFDLYHLPIGMFREFLTTKRFIAHNALFDLGFLRHAGIEGIEMGCTMLGWIILHHAVEADDEGFSAKLVDVTHTLLGTDILKHMQRSDWSVKDLTYEQLLYAGVDAICVLKIAEKLAKGLSKYDLIGYYQLCKKALHPISEIQLNGIKLDVDHHREAVTYWRDELVIRKKEVLELTGLDSLTAHTLADYLQKNLDPQTLALWPRTDKGKLKTDSHAFADFPYLPIVEPFAAYQKKQTLCSTFGTNLFEYINPATGRIHPSYFICGARTGRLSSKKPNGQNMPRDNTVRESFIADEGNVLVTADFSQIELRLAAELSQDPVMLDVFQNGKDLHRLTAAKIAGIPLDQVEDEQRRKAKSFNFGVIFGMGWVKYVKMSKKEYQVDLNEKRARGDITAWKELYQGYTDWHLRLAKEAENTLVSSTPMGKHRRLEEDFTYSVSANNPIQGGAAEVILASLVRVHKATQGNGIRLINTVHDEIVLECKESDKLKAAKILKNCMVEGYLDVFPNGITRDLVEIGAGSNWATSKAKGNRLHV